MPPNAFPPMWHRWGRLWVAREKDGWRGYPLQPPQSLVQVRVVFSWRSSQEKVVLASLFVLAELIVAWRNIWLRTFHYSTAIQVRIIFRCENHCLINFIQDVWKNFAHLILSGWSSYVASSASSSARCWSSCIRTSLVKLSPLVFRNSTTSRVLTSSNPTSLAVSVISLCSV